jgi:hypothetical protein
VYDLEKMETLHQTMGTLEWKKLLQVKSFFFFAFFGGILDMFMPKMTKRNMEQPELRKVLSCMSLIFWPDLVESM